MQKNCEYCGNHFTFQRNTRKYCSDNCKQMAYFKRNGFVPIHETEFHELDKISVKDVKYTSSNTSGLPENPTSKPKNPDVVMMYAKCLIRNLLQLWKSEYIERDTFLEFTATWSQFTGWQTFQKKRSDSPFYDLFVQLAPKLLAIAKSNSENDLVNLVLSEELSNQLVQALTLMYDSPDISFERIRF